MVTIYLYICMYALYMHADYIYVCGADVLYIRGVRCSSTATSLLRSGVVSGLLRIERPSE